MLRTAFVYVSEVTHEIRLDTHCVASMEPHLLPITLCVVKTFALFLTSDSTQTNPNCYIMQKSELVLSVPIACSFVPRLILMVFALET